MDTFFLLTFLACSGSAVVLAQQYCTPSSTPYDANNLATYPLVNQTTKPLQMTTTTLVDTIIQAVKDFIVKKHNCLRTLPSPTAANMLLMQWNAEAAAGAQQHANNCVYQHNANSNRTTSQFSCGQNIAMITGSTPMSWKAVIDMWFNEVNSCNNSLATTCTKNAVIGHFTQIEWAKTWQVGCGWKKCASMNFYVCNYCPAGNFVGQTPYISGASCASCPGKCSQGKLCTNPCLYTDVYSNCASLMAPTDSCKKSSYRNSCRATCLCGRTDGLSNSSSG